jgi:hypothetical protein
MFDAVLGDTNRLSERGKAKQPIGVPDCVEL